MATRTLKHRITLEAEVVVRENANLEDALSAIDEFVEGVLGTNLETKMYVGVSGALIDPKTSEELVSWSI